MNIGMLIGSLRRESFNRKVAMTLKKLAPQSVDMITLEIGDLPLFNQDLEPSPPTPWVNFREKLTNLDGVLIVTPEYNRSMPAALKNALDVGSRPYGKNLWDGKPCAVVSASVGMTGAFGSNHHVRQSLVFLNMPCLQQPEVYLSYVDKLFDEKGQLTNESTLNFLNQFMQKFVDWVSLNK